MSQLVICHSPQGAPTRRVALEGRRFEIGDAELVRAVLGRCRAQLGAEEVEELDWGLEGVAAGRTLPRSWLRMRLQDDTVGLRRGRWWLDERGGLCRAGSTLWALPHAVGAVHAVAASRSRESLAGRVLARGGGGSVLDHAGVVLGLRGRDWGVEEVRAAFCRAVRSAHPDVGGSGGDVAAVVSARDVLLAHLGPVGDARRE